MKSIVLILALTFSVVGHSQVESFLANNEEGHSFVLNSDLFSAIELDGGWQWVDKFDGYLALGEGEHQILMLGEELEEAISLDRGAFVAFTDESIYIEKDSDFYVGFSGTYVARAKSYVYDMKDAFASSELGECWVKVNSTGSINDCSDPQLGCWLVLKLKSGEVYVHEGKCGSKSSKYSRISGTIRVEGMTRKQRKPK